MSGELLRKLGWRGQGTTLLWRVPDAFKAALSALEAYAGDAATFRIAFSHSKKELAEAAQEVAAGYVAGGHLWLCYPKKSGSIRTDLTRDIGWEPVHALDLLGVTQIAMDQDWSALRFRHRAEISKLTRRTATGRAAENGV